MENTRTLNAASQTPPSGTAKWVWSAGALPAGFVLLAIWLVATSGRPDIPVVDTPAVDPVSLLVAPRREAMGDPPHTMVEGLPENCNACHQIFDSSSPSGAALSYHQEITLSHGLNARCVNCHDPHDRERLTLRDGSTIPFADTPLLCAQCHGTTYRDWQRGTHGKTLGSWITQSSAQQRLTCNQCHDPHSPRYQPYTPLPGPRTLRMGEPPADGASHDSGAQGPLQQWLRDRAAHPHTGSEAHP